MAFFGPKPWANHFGKMSIFRLFELFFFLKPKKAFFRSRISLKRFSWPRLPKKNCWKNSQFRPKPWVNPLKKFEFFDFLNFLFIYP